MRNVNRLFESGNRAQKEKLEKYKKKRDWCDIPVGLLAVAAKNELLELHEAVQNMINAYANACITGVKIDHKKEIELINEIRHEAADVANYAHMIIVNSDRKIESLNESAKNDRTT